jgi:hypothetical protein
MSSRQEPGVPRPLWIAFLISVILGLLLILLAPPGRWVVPVLTGLPLATMLVARLILWIRRQRP